TSLAAKVQIYRYFIDLKIRYAELRCGLETSFGLNHRQSASEIPSAGGSSVRQVECAEIFPGLAALFTRFGSSLLVR
ncbi:hypothetical protein, partial [Bradyrhizobium sp. Leo170]|uniref:hypothetical protein n=1 Tax=Bradyrhizobium sp. Leo170 TaxID=1571199 RepID=UPI001A92B82F